MAQILVIDDNVKQLVQQLRENAEKNPLTLAQMQAIMAGQAPPIGDRPGFLVELPIGITLAYSIEEHPGKQMRHVSASVHGRLPSPAMMEQILDLIGFANPLSNCIIYMEQGNRAMNILEPASSELLPHGVYVN